MRKFVVLAVAIVVFGVVVALVIALAPSGAPGPDLPAPVVDGRLPELPPIARNIPPTAPLPPPPRPDYGPPPFQPPEGTWESVTPVPRLSNLGPAGAAVGRDLMELQPRLSACFDEVSQARHGQRRYSATQDEGRLAEAGTTVLVLQLEMRPGEVRIVDAPVETRGGASDGLIACAQAVLRGRTIEVPESRASMRARVMYPLVQ